MVLVVVGGAVVVLVLVDVVVVELELWHAMQLLYKVPGNDPINSSGSTSTGPSYILQQLPL